MKKTILAASLFLLTFLASCELLLIEPEPQLTPLQLKSLQSRSFEHPKDIVFASVVSVFQDLGYSISNADKDTGIINAESAENSNRSNALLDVLLELDSSVTTEKTLATAFIERIGSRTHVRLNFLRKSRRQNSSERGQFSNDEPILDAKIYQNAFERIESAIFVRSAN